MSNGNSFHRMNKQKKKNMNAYARMFLMKTRSFFFSRNGPNMRAVVFGQNVGVVMFNKIDDAIDTNLVKSSPPKMR